MSLDPTVKKIDRPGDSRLLVGVLVALYVIEGAVVLGAMVLYKNAHRSFLTAVTGRHGPLFVAAVLAVIVAATYLGRRYRRASGPERRTLRLTAAMNLVSVMVAVVVAEALIRSQSHRTAAGPVVADTLLLPRRWDDTVARARRLLEQSPTAQSYFVPDARLGWTVGASRQSRDGLYASSLEGIRSARPGVSFAATVPGHRVALVGDSFTFGLEVPFEGSWGHQLEQRLRPRAQVLNFGVDGYGVDQAYLRYARDVRPWRPDVAILGFIDHDLYRSIAVYPFMSFPRWGLPFAKPRFVLHDGRLELLNTPVPSPEQIFRYRAVSDLPVVTRDPGYRAHEWQWNALYHSFLARFLVSRFPRHEEPPGEFTDAAVIALNTELLRAFASLARAEGTVPLIVFFPSEADFRGHERPVKNAVVDAVRRSDVRYEDLTPCVATVPPGDRFNPGHPHYSPAANAAIATCLAPLVAPYLDGSRPSSSRETSATVSPGR